MQVVNFKDYKNTAALTAAFGVRWVYAGRAMPRAGLKGSPLANPFKLKDYSIGDPRTQAIQAYERFLRQMLRATNPKGRAIQAALDALRPDSVLVCWCSPDPCHADVIIDVWQERHG